MRYHYIYVDDIREDDSWFNHHMKPSVWNTQVCRTYDQTIEFIAKTMKNEECMFFLDLDHDLGEGNENELEKSGYDICKWIVENHIPLVGFHIHSANPVGRKNMQQLLTHYGYEEFF